MQTLLPKQLGGEIGLTHAHRCVENNPECDSGGPPHPYRFSGKQTQKGPEMSDLRRKYRGSKATETTTQRSF